MPHNRVIAAAAVLTLMIGALAGCATDPSASDSNAVLRVGINSGEATLNPAINLVGRFQNLSNEGLIHETDTGTYEPSLATEFGYVGTGNTEFRLKLRDHVVFSDGTPLNAAAVKEWIQYYHDSNGPLAKGVDLGSIDTPDDLTVVIHLTSPNPDLLFLLSDIGGGYGLVSSPAAVRKPNALKTQTFGVGPYVIDPARTVAGAQNGAKFVFVPNKKYYDQSAIHFHEIDFTVYTQPSTMLAAVQTHQLDIAQGDISTNDAAKSSGLDLVGADTGWIGFLMMDRGPYLPGGTTVNPLHDVRVRQALNYAVNRAAIISGIVKTSGTATSQAPTTNGVNPEYDGYYTYDPQKAKQLLAEAGYANGFTLKVTSQSYIGTLGDPVLQAFANDLSHIGVTLKITTTSSVTDFVNAIFSGDWVATGFLQQPYLTMSQFYGYYTGKDVILSQNGSDDPVLDALYAQARVAADPGPIWQEMSARTVQQADIVPLFRFKSYWYTQTDIQGVHYSPNTAFPDPLEWTRK
jgi:peptide/nickel transport system substrate-binding protein